MKRRVGIFLFCIYLFGATDACQLLKLPLLVAHYLEHKRENPYTTLGSFYQMHYLDPQPMDADYAKDMRLPFKTTPDAFFRHTPSVVLSMPVIELKLEPVDNEAPPLFNENPSSALLINTIFQPPRV